MSETTVQLSDSATADYTLDFIEQQMFYGYDAAYQAYTTADHPFEKETREQELRAYEDAMDAITHIRRRLETERTASLDASARVFEAVR